MVFGSDGTGNRRFSLARLSDDAMSRRMNEEYAGHPEERLPDPQDREQQAAGVQDPAQSSPADPAAAARPRTDTPTQQAARQQLMAALQGQGDVPTAIALYQQAFGEGGGSPRQRLPRSFNPPNSKSGLPPPGQQAGQLPQQQQVPAGLPQQPPLTPTPQPQQPCPTTAATTEQQQQGPATTSLSWPL